MQIGLVRRLAVLGGALVMLQGTMALAAQVDMFLTIDGIKGAAAGGAIHVTSVVHPKVDAAMGMASGKRQHSPITITKEVDSASPKLFEAMNSKKPLGAVTISFKGASGGGAGKSVETVKLTNAMVTSIRKSGNTATITLDYSAEEVTWTDGGKTATDDWDSPK